MIHLVDSSCCDLKSTPIVRKAKQYPIIIKHQRVEDIVSEYFLERWHHRSIGMELQKVDLYL